MQHLPNDPVQIQHVLQNLASIYLVGNPHLHPATDKKTSAIVMTQAIKQWSTVTIPEI
jgi:hypothetical protein